MWKSRKRRQSNGCDDDEDAERSMHSGGGGGIFGGLMQRATRGSWENEASHDGSSDRVDADVASVISFNMNEFDAETQKRVFKRTSSFVMEETPEEKQHTNCCIRCLVSVWSFLEAHWSALLTSSFIFLVLSIGSVALCILYFQGLEEQMEEEGLELALETGRYFSTELAKTTLPLLSMSQLVHELDIFTNLTNQIGAGNEEGGLPFSTSRPNYRNLTGSPCLDLNLRVKFNQVAFQIRKSFSSLERGNMGGEPVLLTNSLLSLSLAPAGVLCLTTPEIDSENFETNHPLNTTHRLGFDYTATYTASQLFGNATAPAVHLDGPTLMTIPCRKGDSGGAGGGCRGDGVSAWVFEVRLPVEIPGLQLQLLQEDGTRTAYPFWGMVVSHVRWDAIIESSTVFQDFEDMGFHFQMVRSGLEAHHGDIQVHGDNEGHIMNDGDAPILLESLRFQEVLTLKNYHVDTIALDPTFTGDEWSMTVVHRAPAQERIWMIPLLVFVSLCVSFLIFKILLQKQEHSSMKGRAMAQESQFETERNMTAYFAHELRNPLSAMDSALKAMPEDNELPPSATELIAGMRICASFMSSIMNNLLDVRKMEEGALSLKRVPVNLERILASLHRMFLPNVKPGVDFQWRSEFTSKDQGWVIGDSHRLQQIFTNVITNALKYTSHGSVILSVGWERDFVSSASASDQQGSSSATEDTVDASARDTLRGPFASTVNASGHVQDYKSYNEDDNAVSSDHDSSLEEQRDRPPPTILRKRESKVMEARKHILPTGPPRIRFECADTGPGILKSHQDQLFKKFVQRGGAPGTGLGLAISKHLVELMGGEIYYKSDPTVKPGSSCIVLLPLPLCDAPPGESDDDEDEAAVKSSKKRAGAADSKKDVPMIQEPISVLIVDDIRMNRMMLKRRLQKAIAPNALITESPNGETALEICEREIFDVIIMDQFMEDAGGLLLGTDTILALRREGVKAMIIGCSGNDIDKEFVEAGADQCWQKPLPTNETIIRQLRRHLDKNR